jgi:hypothetical protein
MVVVPVLGLEVDKFLIHDDPVVKKEDRGRSTFYRGSTNGRRGRANAKLSIKLDALGISHLLRGERRCKSGSGSF